eukprot:GHUV01049982.1.p1 GENE.GHUV01049982.1~~GHUV01049982.1.p1  ORF type:complete len:161 (+),score=40.20 GHUV01049982.1:3-485(+)
MSQQNADGKRGRRTSATNADRFGRRSKKGGSEAGNKKQRTGFAKFKHDMYKKLLGWMDPRFHRKGKKLEGNSSAVWWVMIPLGIWLVLLIAISFVSYDSLRQLQGPLVSLDTATHGKVRCIKLSQCNIKCLCNCLRWAATPAVVAAAWQQQQHKQQQSYR